MVIVVLVMFTMCVAVAEGHLVFVFMMRKADRIAWAFLIEFYAHVLVFVLIASRVTHP
jgi:hypothetical protein